MRFLYSFLLLLILCPNAFALDLSYHVPANLPDVISFQGIQLHRAFEEARGDAFIVEYIPKGQTLEKWTYLFAIRKERFGYSPAIRVKGFADHLKTKNPEFRSQTLFDKNQDAAAIDFMLWTEDGSLVEFNSWKFYQAEQGCLISYQFARRGYNKTQSIDDLMEFMPKKNDAVKEMLAFELPGSAK